MAYKPLCAYVPIDVAKTVNVKTSTANWYAVSFAIFEFGWKNRNNSAKNHGKGVLYYKFGNY